MLQEARLLARNKDFTTALSKFQQLTEQHSASAELWLEYGNVALDAEDFPLAESAYQKAIDLQPHHSAKLLEIGHNFALMRRTDKAFDCFTRAAAADPNAINPRISLAVFHEKQNRLSEARAALQQCLHLDPHDEQARYFSALLDRREGNLESAERALRALLSSSPSHPVVRRAARYELATVLDQTQRYDEAMRWLLEAKQLSWSIADINACHRDYDAMAIATRRLLASIPHDILKTWNSSFPSSLRSPMPAHALLGGHPRSGTTLLERILDAHPSITALDESSIFLQEISRQFPPLNAAMLYDLARFNRLSAESINALRQCYLQRFKQELGRSCGSLLLDKNPSPTAMLPFWLRFFPELRVLIALRDPRDVLISCFFTNIPLNVISANFITLQRTAHHYAELMNVWLTVRQWQGLHAMETRYEDLVANLEKEGTRVTEFLGLSWCPDQKRFYENAPSKPIFSPTYRDVTQNVYRRAIGRWRAYEKHLAPLLPILEPYLKALGYGT
jgi:tetratricopeptide (TPR) repeat protein